MKRDIESAALQHDWEERQANYGDTPRAVLMKGVPDRVNTTIDYWHRTVLRSAFSHWSGLSGSLLDVGCGYGRLAAEAESMGVRTLVGLDFSPGFCRSFASAHGPAVCGDLLHLPFASGTFMGAYAVTSLMYLDIKDARAALCALGECVVPGGRVLILEPGAEFNGFVRAILGRKREEKLVRPGFSEKEFCRQLAPSQWRLISSGSNAVMTLLFPILILVSRIPSLYSMIERIALRMDRPMAGKSPRSARYAIYRWAIYETAGADPSIPLRSTQT